MKIDLDAIERKARDLESHNTMGEYDPALILALIDIIRDHEAYIDAAKAAGAGDRVSGEPLAEYITRLRAELAEARSIGAAGGGGE